MRYLAVILIAAGLLGCSRETFHVGDEVLAVESEGPESRGLELKPAHQIVGHASWDEDRQLRWIPVGTRLRIASGGQDGRRMVMVLEGEHRGVSLSVNEHFLRRP